MDPAEYTPPTGTAFLGYADDPEWQCQADPSFWGDSFLDMPLHCQKRMLQDLGAARPQTKKESPTKLTDSPMPQDVGGQTSSGAVMAFALTSSAKKDDKKPETVPGPNTPHPCPWDTDENPNDCAATVTDDPPLINITGTGAVAASNGSNSISSRLLSSGVGLSDCVVNLIQSDFTDINVHGRTYNPVTDARFIQGLPTSVTLVNGLRQLLSQRGVNPGAITLGPTIYYQPGQFDIVNPSWEQLEGIAEEISHFEQFLNNWASLPTVQDVQEVGNRGHLQRFTRPPNSGEALISWVSNYMTAYRNTPAGLDPYADNAIEAPAKQKAKDLRDNLQKKSPGREKPCY